MQLRISAMFSEEEKDESFTINTAEGAITLTAQHAACVVNVTGENSIEIDGSPFAPGCHADAIAKPRGKKKPSDADE